MTKEEEETEAEHDVPNEDFLLSYMPMTDDAESDKDRKNNTENRSNRSEADPYEVQYNSRKPKWWKNVAGRTTKAQKQAIANMTSHQLPSIKYGEFYDWDTIFSKKSKDIWLEIGFGQGENLLALSHKYPERCLVGAEIHVPALGKAFQRMQGVMEKNQYWTDYIEFQTGKSASENHSNRKEVHTGKPYSNLRIYRGDGIKILPRIPDHSLSAVLITFPDPFPKKGHEKWRVIQKHSLQDIHRILEPMGKLYLATDHEVFHSWSHDMVEHINEEIKIMFELVEGMPHRTEWLPAISKYEQKGWDEGRQTWTSCWKALK